MKIKFGTSGWRGIISDDITYPRVRIITQAIADYLKQENLHNLPVVVGYDTRFLSEHFARTAAGVLAANGLQALLCDRDTPTPVIAFEILRRKAAGAINITASHNPYDYSGLKYSSQEGGPALPEITQRIEMACDGYLAASHLPKTAQEAVGVKQKLIVPIDPQPYYFKHLERLVDMRALRRGKSKIVVDSLWGAGRGYTDEFLKKCGCQVVSLHTDRDVLFGGGVPNPIPETLGLMRQTMVKQRAQIGLGTDCDADRFGIMDEDGSILSPNELLPLMLDHVVKTRQWKGIVVRSVMTSHFFDAVARKHGLELQETAVGFKYIGDIMARENSVYPSKEGNFILGGEESGGVSIRGHVPEKDGVLACLLAAEMVAVNKKSLRKQLQALQKEVGTFYSQRLNFHLTPEKMIDLKEKLRESPPTKFKHFNVRRIVETDGHKFILTDGSWLGIRLSGTEPVVRIYLETDSPAKVKALEQAGRQLAGLTA
ncbi:MAG TPA: phosphoglucomutase/phosphomannomutase family protein [Elusimicrobiota bacterium]|nr:phosphoglucomutase/phosphomannomutase family protein [Elusimicrobiota bacterium]